MSSIAATDGRRSFMRLRDWLLEKVPVPLGSDCALIFLVKDKSLYTEGRKIGRGACFRGQDFHQKQGKAAAVRLASAFAPGQNASIINRIKRRRAASQFPQSQLYPVALATKSRGQPICPFFGDFLWTSKESCPAAGRNRRS
jgi:hypothetical protein